MNRTDKSLVVNRLVEQLSESNGFYLTDFTGLTVKGITELRRRLRDAGVEYVVAKNTLAQRAFQEVSISGLEDVLRGPTGFVFIKNDPVEAAKVLDGFKKEFEDKPAIKAGLVDGRQVSAGEVKRLASLPGRDGLLAQVGGALQAPLQGMLGALNGMMYQLAGVLEALRQERENAA